MSTHAITRYPVLALGAFAAAAIAAPAQAGQPNHVDIRATATTDGQPSATCVTGVPASTSPYEIDYAAVAAPVSSSSYDIDASFDSAHAVGSTVSLFVTSSGGFDDYTSFKCQYTCNGTPGCVSFFGRFVQVNTTTEHYECLSFDALLDDSAFTLTTQNIANGGFNELCS